MFVELFKKNKEYASADPPVEFGAPSFMHRGVYEFEATASELEEFWSYLCSQRMMANGFEPAMVQPMIEKMLKKKILDIVAKPDAFANMFKLFKQIVMPAEISAGAKLQVEAVEFVATFNEESDVSKLDDACVLIWDKGQEIANALVQFPHGKAILSNAIDKNRKATTVSVKMQNSKRCLAVVVYKFPAEAALTALKDCGDMCFKTFETIGDNQHYFTAAIDTIREDFERAADAIAAFYAAKVVVAIVALDNDMNFLLVEEDIQQVVKKISDVLQCLDDADRQAKGKLLPFKLKQHRVIAPMITTILNVLPFGVEAIKQEFFDKSLAVSISSGVPLLDATQLQETLGDQVSWKAFISKINNSDVVVKARELIGADMQPKAAAMAASVLNFLSFGDFVNITWERLQEFKAALGFGDADIDEVSTFGSKAGDVYVQRQVMMVDRYAKLHRALVSVLTWRLSATTAEARTLNEKNGAVLSGLRQHMRAVEDSHEGLAALFNPGDCGAPHIVKEFDNNMIFTNMGAFAAASRTYLDGVEAAWKDDLTNLADQVAAWCPPWTDENLMEDATSATLLNNPNFNVLGQAAGKLHGMLEAHKTMKKTRQV